MSESNQKRLIVEQGLILVVIYFVVNFVLNRGSVFELVVESIIIGVVFSLFITVYDYWRGRL